MVAPVLDLLRKQFGASVLETTYAHGMLAFIVEPAALAGVVASLRTEFGFDMLLDVTAVDWPQRTPRFDVVYHLYSTAHFVRVRVKTLVAVEAPVVDSLVPQYGSAQFMERECHDMYGIEFRGNADLRPILLYEGFEGHPLRKDYAKDHEQPLVPFRN